MRECSVEARGVSKRYDGIAALAGVDFTAVPGTVHGLLGPNGAGKTTLLRVLLGLTRRDAGTVRVLDTDPGADKALPDGVAGFVDAPSFYPYLSARANLSVLDRLDGHPARDRQPRIAAVLERTGLAPRGGDAVGRYSAGMRQRLGLASVLLRRPRLLLLDEPTSAIDPAGAADVRGILRQLAAAGAAVVFSSHDLESVEQICDTITILDRGRAIFSGSIDELRARVSPAFILRTSDDERALRLAAGDAIRAETQTDGSMLVFATGAALDRYVIALGCAGVAVRHLEQRGRSLESVFLDITGAGAGQEQAPETSDRARDVSLVTS